MPDTKWQAGTSGNPRGRPRRKSVRELVGERGLADVVASMKKATEGGKVPMSAVQAGRVLLEKSVPTPRPETARVEIPGYEEAATPTERANTIMRAAAAGRISPTVAVELTSALASSIKVAEVDELAQRLAAIEQQLATRRAR